MPGGPPAEPRRLDTAPSLEEALSAPLFLLFKHSPICPTSTVALRQLRRFLAEDPAPPTGLVDVIAGRPLSLRVAERTGVRHESPQALLLARGEVLWHASHGGITRQALARAVGAAQSGR